MAKSKSPPVTAEAIRTALRSAAEEFLIQFSTAHPGETMYGFLFEVSVEGFDAHAAVGTEEGLARFSDQMHKRNGAPLDAIKAEFRWGSTEDAWYQQPKQAFRAVNRLLGQAERQELYDYCDGTLEELCLGVLKELDAAGIFGRGADRERLVLGLCYIGGDNSEHEFLAWAKQVNPPVVMKRLKRELKAANAAAE